MKEETIKIKKYKRGLYLSVRPNNRLLFLMDRLIAVLVAVENRRTKEVFLGRICG